MEKNKIVMTDELMRAAAHAYVERFLDENPEIREYEKIKYDHSPESKKRKEELLAAYRKRVHQ